MTTRAAHFLIPDWPYLSYSAYRAATGPGAVEAARRHAPGHVIAELAASGLRGRGGAGFPAAEKWKSVRGQACTTRSVVCNAAEGEPGTFKDRWLIRHNPYALLEGMLVAAHAVGTTTLRIGIKRSFRAEVARLRDAVNELAAAGLLSGFDVGIVEGPEDYLFGEEKALLEVLSGGEAMPRRADEPPYEVGLYPKPGSPNPALVHNAETFAHVPSIVREGAASFRAIGTPDTPGTLLVTVSGDVIYEGVWEVPAGTSLREVVELLAGGPRPHRKLKAILSGVSSPALPAGKLDTPLEFGAMKAAGGSLGSAGFVVYDDGRSMARVAQMAARFLWAESCNQCFACKAGLRVASRGFDAFVAKPERGEAVEQAVAGARSAPQGNRCALPSGGALLLPSLVARFPEDFRGAARFGEPVPVPKLVEYHAAARRFVLEPDQSRWSFADPREGYAARGHAA